MKLKKVTICTIALILNIFNADVLAFEDIKQFPDKTHVSVDKNWTIKFNSPINQGTISNNIAVTDSKGNKVNTNIFLGKEDNSIVVGAQTEGYIPASIYYLNIGTGVESLTGKKLDKPSRMKFVTENKCLDGSNYNGLPKINSLRMKYESILPSQNQIFYVSSSEENVQYRIYVSKYIYGYNRFTDYEEITKGYVYAKNGSITPNQYFQCKEEGQKYKVLVYVKRAGEKGIYKDSNTDFDNYHVDYFRCVNSTPESKNTVNYNVTLDEILDKQFSNKVSVTDEGQSIWVGASRNQIKYYLNPNNFRDGYGKYMFLKLNYTDDSITKEDLNSILKDKGILEEQGETFIKASKANNINPVYLVSHALHETANGKSKLSCGIEVEGKEGKKKVYNMYGISAFDSSPEKSGSEYAYSQGWFTPEEAIIGGAKYIAEKYINNPTKPRETLYEMRWNPYTPGSYQYATDIGWAYKQIKNIKLLMDKCKNPTLKFEIPIYKK